MEKRNIKNYIGGFIVMFAIAGPANVLISTYTSYFFTDIIGVSAAVVGTVLSISVIIDGVSDFVMGIVMDRVTTKTGKARHWFLWMAIPLSVAGSLIFAIPKSFTGISTIIYFFLVYNIFCTIFTAVRLPASSLPSLITDDINIRTTYSFFAACAMVAGPMLISNFIVPMIKLFKDERTGYMMVNIIFAVTTGILILTSYFLLDERRVQRTNTQYSQLSKERKEREIGRSIVNLLKNEKWIFITLASMMYNFGFGFTTGSMVYYCKYVIGNPAAFGTLFTSLTAPTIISYLFVLPLTKKYDKRKLTLFMGAIGVCGFIMPLLYPENITFVAISMAMRGIFFAPFTMLEGTFVASACDYGYYKTGLRQEGMSYCGKSVFGKIASALASALLGFILTANGYVGGGDVVSGNVMIALKIVFLAMPMIFYMLCFAFIYCFKLSDEQVEQIQKKIFERE